MNTTVETLPIWRDYYELTKPRVVMPIVFTAIVGMFLSVPGWPGAAPLVLARSASISPHRRLLSTTTFWMHASISR